MPSRARRERSLNQETRSVAFWGTDSYASTLLCLPVVTPRQQSPGLNAKSKSRERTTRQQHVSDTSTPPKRAPGSWVAPVEALVGPLKTREPGVPRPPKKGMGFLSYSSGLINATNLLVSLLVIVRQGWPILVLEGHCHACFRCFPAPAHLFQMNGCYQALWKPGNDHSFESGTYSAISPKSYPIHDYLPLNTT